MKRGQQGNPVSVADQEIDIKDLGFIHYVEAHKTQLDYVNELLENHAFPDTLLLVEHPSVFTLGRQGREDGFLLRREEIEKRGVDIVHSERGGDVTFHGPGQLVVYPIISLRRRNLSVSHYVYLLEEIMVRTSADFGVTVLRDQRNRGVWVGDNKIGSVGIRVRHGVSFHGLALNVNMSLTPFSWIQPCGLSGVGVTSLDLESAGEVDFMEVKGKMKYHMTEIFGNNGQVG